MTVLVDFEFTSPGAHASPSLTCKRPLLQVKSTSRPKLHPPLLLPHQQNPYFFLLTDMLLLSLDTSGFVANCLVGVTMHLMSGLALPACASALLLANFCISPALGGAFLLITAVPRLGLGNNVAAGALLLHSFHLTGCCHWMLQA